jgi:ribonuclease HII
MTPRNNKKRGPDQSFEIALRMLGIPRICGVDEAGRGPLAGPVVAAAVVMPPGVRLPGVDDSKRVSAVRREQLNEEIIRIAEDYCIAVVDAGEIDERNILQATLQGMKRAVDGLRRRPDFVLVDGNKRMPADVPQQCIIDGDAFCFSVAAASIIAKCHRDRLMRDYDVMYPGYGFARHKGYGTSEHIMQLNALGPAPIHRLSFAPVRAALREIAPDG